MASDPNNKERIREEDGQEGGGDDGRREAAGIKNRNGWTGGRRREWIK